MVVRIAYCALKASCALHGEFVKPPWFAGTSRTAYVTLTAYRRLSEGDLKEIDAAVGTVLDNGSKLEDVSADDFPLPRLGPVLQVSVGPASVSVQCLEPVPRVPHREVLVFKPHSSTSGTGITDEALATPQVVC